ncbi:MAG: hypothetical protein JNM12_07285 [Alphaproteobacteria bacterium]|nr:hypothetical protein [Alphaproteobacteria bacterium]
MEDDFNYSASNQMRIDTFQAATSVHMALFEALFDLANERGGAKMIEDDRFTLLQRNLARHQLLERNPSDHYLPRLQKIDRQIMATTFALARDYFQPGLFDMLTHTTESTPLIVDDLKKFPEMKDYAELFERKLNAGPRRGFSAPRP